MDPSQKLKEQAGEVGCEIATKLTEKVTEAIAGFPASTREQRAAIATIIADGVGEWADAHLDEEVGADAAGS